jgi:hypothetical protein
MSTKRCGMLEKVRPTLQEVLEIAQVLVIAEDHWAVGKPLQVIQELLCEMSSGPSSKRFNDRLVRHLREEDFVVLFQYRATVSDELEGSRVAGRGQGIVLDEFLRLRSKGFLQKVR